MSALTADEFIALYESDPEESDRWLLKKEMDLTTLFKSQAEVTRLAAVFKDKYKNDKDGHYSSPIRRVIIRAGHQIADLYSSLDELLALEKTSDTFTFYLYLLRKGEGKIFSLCSTYEQFMTALKASSFLPHFLIERAPDKVANLFTSYNQFIALDIMKERTGGSIASKLIQHSPDKVADLFTSHNHFIELRRLNSTLAEGLFKHAADKISGLFTSYEEFIAVVNLGSSYVIDPFTGGRDLSLATSLFNHNPNKISAFFTNCNQFMALMKANFLLAKSVVFYNPKIGSLFTNCDQFMQLIKECKPLAYDVLLEHKDHLASLFTSEKAIQKLRELDPLYAEIVSNSIDYPFSKKAQQQDEPPSPSVPLSSELPVYSENPEVAFQSLNTSEAIKADVTRSSDDTTTEQNVTNQAAADKAAADKTRREQQLTNVLRSFRVIEEKSLEFAPNTEARKYADTLIEIFSGDKAGGNVGLKQQYIDGTLTPDAFKTKAKKAIEKAHEELDKHRGWKEILVNLTVAIFSLGIGYLIAALCKHTIFPVKVKTDSNSKLCHMEEAIDKLAYTP